MVSTCYIKCSTLLIGMVGCFVHAHHDHQTEWNEDTAYELGEGGEGRGGEERSRRRGGEGEGRGGEGEGRGRGGEGEGSEGTGREWGWKETL